MKRIVILLVALNVVIFVYFQLPDSASSNAHQALPDLHPDKVKVLSDKEVQALPITSGGAEASSNPTE